MEPDIRDLARVARRRGWIVMVAAILGGVTLLVAGLLQDERYAADARLLVLPAGGARDSYNALLTSQSLSETYRQMIESEPMFARIQAEFALPETLLELDESVSTVVLPGSLLIEITVEDEDPERAATIATAFADEFVTYLGEIAQVDSEGGGLTAGIEVSDPATVPDKPVSPRIPLLVVLGITVGVLTGIAIVVWLELRSVLRGDPRIP